MYHSLAMVCNMLLGRDAVCSNVMTDRKGRYQADSWLWIEGLAEP